MRYNKSTRATTTKKNGKKTRNKGKIENLKESLDGVSCEYIEFYVFIIFIVFRW